VLEELFFAQRSRDLEAVLRGICMQVPVATTRVVRARAEGGVAKVRRQCELCDDMLIIAFQLALSILNRLLHTSA
jgi:hypothetical protein